MKKIIFLSVIISIVLSSCAKVDPVSPINDYLYYNSFETAEDVAILQGAGYSLSDITPTDGGAQSVEVSGGCIGPHLFFEVGPFEDAKSLRISLDGKKGAGLGGSVFVSSQDGIMFDFINLESELWQTYTFDELYKLPADEIVRIEFMAGGIAAGLAYFDEIKITEE